MTRPLVRRMILLFAFATVVDLLAAAPPSKPAGIDLVGMDRAVAPGDDFYAYANGEWVKHTEIPADRPAYGVMASVTEITDKRTADLIVEASKAGAPAGSDARKVGDYYASFMDEAAVEARGSAPLKPALDAVAAIRDRRDLARLIGTTLRADVDVLNATNLYTDNLFGLWVSQDLEDPSRYAPFLLQGGLGLPDRDYFLDPSPRMSEVRAKYASHVAAMMKLAKLAGADAPARAARVVALEMKIAQVHESREASGNVVKGNNHWPRTEFASRAPGLDWEAFFRASGLGAAQDFVVWQPGAFTGIAKLAGSEPLDVWKDYLAFHAVRRHAAVLPKAFVEESFAFNGRVIQGTTQLRDRWKRAVSATNGALGDAVGKLYVARYFPASEKARAEAMVANLIAAFGARIGRLDWMAPETKAKAKAKLAVLKVGVGYPDHWVDYSGLEVVRGDAYGNAERAGIFETRRQIAKLGRPVDRSEWVMLAQLVNAVNLPSMNAMNFPAGILQPPYFDPSRPEVMDYGAIGAVIGHEISHSFDDQGALFDADGRLKNWWTPVDFEHFKASAEALARQYDAYRPFPDLALNGKQTLGENIADVAGLAVAYDGYRLSLGRNSAPSVGGLTGDQLFFVSYAQTWRQKTREPALRQQVVVDAHSPGPYRAATVRNLDAWYEAFVVKAGQALYLAPGERVKIW